MRVPETHDRFLNQRATLPYDIEPIDIVSAIQEFYEYWHDVNEWHIKRGYGRFHEQFRANNAIGGFVGTRVARRLANEVDGLVENPMDDGYPDLVYVDGDYQLPDGGIKNEDAPGIEVKTKRSTSSNYYAHHEFNGWLLGITYKINARGRSDSDVAPVETPMVSCALVDPGDWTYEDAQESNRTNTARLSRQKAHRTNPIYQTIEGIPEGTEHADIYRRLHACFDPVYANENPDELPKDDGSNVCPDCGEILKNSRGVSQHMSIMH